MQGAGARGVDVRATSPAVHQPLVPDQHGALAHGHAVTQRVDAVAVAEFEAPRAAPAPHQSVALHVVVRRPAVASTRVNWVWGLGDRG